MFMHGEEIFGAARVLDDRFNVNTEGASIDLDRGVACRGRERLTHDVRY